MKKLVAGLLSVLGIAQAPEAEPQVQRMDPRQILFSMSTLAEEIPPFEQRAAEPSASDLVFHEDEWRQVEFYPAARLPEIEQTMRALKEFESQNRVASGWRQIFTRRVPARPIFQSADSVSALARELAATPQGAPFLFTGASAVTGRIANGFSIPLGPGAWLYGYQDQAIVTLGAYLNSADDRILTNAFVALNRGHQLVLVDWRAEMILVGVAADGNILMWRP